MDKAKNSIGAVAKLEALKQLVINTPPERMRAYIRAGLMELGWLGVVGVGIIVMCVVIYFSALQPGDQRVRMLRDKFSQLDKPGVKPGGNLDSGPNQIEQLAIFYAAFPGRSSVPAALEKIYSAASVQDLHLDRADYKASAAIAGKLTRYQVTLPVKGGYSNIHKFLVQVLRDVPTASLERVLFERKKIDDNAVDATVTFVLYLGPES